jgi:predicted RNase H-like HicB family nuclease
LKELSDDTPRRLISMISTAGKTPEQVKDEAHQAFQKYFDANPESRPPNYPPTAGEE